MESNLKNDQNVEVINIDVDPNNPIQEIESLCMNCHKQGITRLLQKDIPYFKTIVIMCFECPHCGYKNTEIENASELADKGVIFTLKVTNVRDLSRQIIKSNYATISIPYCGFEIPKQTQKGKLSTLEGFITDARDNFQGSLDCGYYKEMDENFINKIKELISKLNQCLDGTAFPFELILNDPSGNSFIENPYAPQTDTGIKLEYFQRTKEQLEEMGYSVENQIMENETSKKKDENNKNNNLINKTNKESEPKLFVDPLYYDKVKQYDVYKSNSDINKNIISLTTGMDDKKLEKFEHSLYTLPSECPQCHTPGEMNSCQLQIPYFKEIIIMCFKCDKCGFKNCEVKGGGGISPKGMKMTLHVESMEDINRDLFKSEYSSVSIPEVGFESTSGSLGSMFTTVEGLLDKIIENVNDNPFVQGDSVEDKNKFDIFIQRLKGLSSLKEKFTLIIDDPLSNSFIFSPLNQKDDKKLIKEEYERTSEQNDALGISQMKIDNY